MQLGLGLNGRLTFVRHGDPSPKDLALLLYGPSVSPGYDVWMWANEKAVPDRRARYGSTGVDRPKGPFSAPTLAGGHAAIRTLPPDLPGAPAQGALPRC